MCVKLRYFATTIDRVPHSGPQSAVPVALAGSLLVADAEDIFQRLRQTNESLGNELAA